MMLSVKHQLEFVTKCFYFATELKEGGESLGVETIMEVHHTAAYFKRQRFAHLF